MNIHHFEKGISYNPEEMLMLAKKIGRLARYCSRLKDEASVIRLESERRETKKDRDQVKVMITVELPKAVLRAESRRPRVLDAVDRCIEKLEPQIKRYKDLHSRRGRARVAMRRRAA